MRAPDITAGRTSGFSLVEVMVAVVVICVGLLGIAKMQSLAMSSTNMARMRSLAALEAASLAAAMHANRSYWAGANGNPPPPALITYDPVNLVQGLAAVLSPAVPAASSSPTTIAEYDFGNWVTGLSELLPGANATVSCSGATPPVNCTINITWTENPVAMTQQEAQQSAGNPLQGFNNPTYTLDVEP
ncbi:MAG: type IV pilus modification protein PilV [Steroidobacteraceae bacterium]